MSARVMARRARMSAVVLATFAALASAVFWRAGPADAAGPLPPHQATFVATTVNGSCGLLTDGFTARCWGEAVGNLLSPPPGSFAQISAASENACGLRVDGTVTCWGLQNNPVVADPPPAGARFTQIDVGSSVVCGLKTDTSLACWGNRSTNASAVPPGTGFVQVEAGAHACAVRNDGTLTCWGGNLAEVRAVPVLPAGITYRTVANANTAACAVTSAGYLVCWGRGAGELLPPAGTDFAQINGGSAHFCALRTDGSAVCWGGNSYGELNVPTGMRFTEISAGGNHTCALTDSTMRIVCWGSGFQGQTNAPAVNFGPLVDLTPPTIVPTVTGTLGQNGWYVSNVDVSWTVTDDQTPITGISGCDPTTVTDTPPGGITLTCSAKSAGGATGESVTVNVDTTPPALSPTVSPTSVPVGGAITATSNASDGGSGLAEQGCAAVDTTQAGTFSVACFAVDNAGLRSDQTVSYTVTAPPPPPPPPPATGCPARKCEVELEGKIGTGANRPKLEAEFEVEGKGLSGELKLSDGQGRNERRLVATGRPTSLSVTDRKAVATGKASYNGAPGTFELTVEKGAAGTTVTLVFRQGTTVVATWTGKLTGEATITITNRSHR